MIVRKTRVQRLLKAVEAESVTTAGVAEVHIGATISLGGVHAIGRYRLNHGYCVNEEKQVRHRP
jgi:hypothetical protein